MTEVKMEHTKLYHKNSPMPREKFSQLYEIMEYSFPPNERGSENLHYSELSRPEFRCLCYEPDNIPLAFLNYYEFPETETIFVEHFAVSEELRGRGTGSAIMEHLKRTTSPFLIVLEVEPPDGPTERRRIDFYKRLGFHMNDGEYFQPEFYGKSPAIPLKLMTTRELGEREFSELARFIHKRVYRK